MLGANLGLLLYGEVSVMIVKNKIIANTTILSFLGSKMIKISGLGTGL